MRRSRAAAPLVLALLGSAVGVPAVAAADDPPPLVDGMLTIDGAPATNLPDVTLRLAAPASSDGVVRVSNDGSTWVILPWAATIQWSLVDPATGGTDADGTRTVTVDVGDGVAWHARDTADITLDRVAPTLESAAFRVDGDTWVATVTPGPGEMVSQARYSIDGSTWTAWGSLHTVDLWPMPGTGTWATGDRMMWMQTRDDAGNVSDPVAGQAVIDLPAFDGWTEGSVAVEFTFPRLPITGQLFTIRPEYPAGYTLPADAWCEWTLHWGDDASIMDLPNPTWGEIIFERPKSSGACTEWTFTLPFVTARQFHWQFQLVRKDPGQDWGVVKEGLFWSGNGADHIIRAAQGSTDPRILTSSPPIAYLLPETTISQAGDSVTYRLHVASTSTVPQTGTFWTYPLNCYLNPHWSQDGGYTFTYTPKCNGPWVTGWTGTMRGGYMRSQYDPIVDGRAPNVVAPKASIRGASFGTLVPVTIAWSATDKGSGVYRYQLEVRRNGGAWKAIQLSTRRTSSITRSLAASGTYQFRARARDRVGNWSAWTAGPLLRARALQETTTAARWSSGWSVVRDPASSGGAAKSTSAEGATVRFTATARSLAWVARRGPGRGLAQVYADGALVATIDLEAPTSSTPRVLFAKTWGGGAASHTIVVRNLGTAGRAAIEADAFLVLR